MVKKIRIVEEKIGSQYLFTSPDVPGLYVAHTDRETALRGIQPMIEAMDRVRQRYAAKTSMEHKAAAFG